MSISHPVWLVEDDEVDVMILKRALKKLNISHPLTVFKNGEEALFNVDDKSKPLPCLILMDLNMPRMNGLELLDHLKEHPVFRKIPAVVITSSNAKSDREYCFEHGAAGYFVKPADFNAFVETIRKLENYWSHNQLPPGIS